MKKKTQRKGGIRTHGVAHDGFQDRCLKPLSHPFQIILIFCLGTDLNR